LYKKYSAACGGRIKFFSARILLILQSKINKIRALKNILWRRKPPKDVPEAFYTTPECFLNAAFKKRFNKSPSEFKS